MALPGPAEEKRRIGVVIGGSGLIGGTVVNYFKSKTNAPIEILAPSSKKLSMREPQDIDGYMCKIKPDFIVNAAITNINSDSRLAYEVNYLGPLNLARTAIKLGIPYIHISSAATLKEGMDLTEKDCRVFSPKMSNYAKSKLMAEKSLQYLHENLGLDYTCIRLSVVYGNHDHKVQGFHRMLFAIADESMPFLFTRKGVLHSYSNSRKLPFFIHHILDNREEFSGKTYNFVDKEPINLPTLILTIKSYLQLSAPREFYFPFWLADISRKGVMILLRILRKFGLKAELPPELIFMKHFYRTQTLCSKRFRESSFVDPFPDETVYTRLPDMVIYYLTRWSHQNLISTFDEEIRPDKAFENDFDFNPELLLRESHNDMVEQIAGKG